MLHTIKEWEERSNSTIKFIAVFFNDNRQVRKIKGRFNHPYKGWISVHWDGFGKCYVGTKRVNEGDIKFE